jgi:hypothetical protein
LFDAEICLTEQTPKGTPIESLVIGHHDLREGLVTPQDNMAARWRLK